VEQRLVVVDKGKEIRWMVQEAVELHLEGLRQEGIPVPKPSSFAGEVEISPAA
jgi:predicted RNase H-like HicB family nuclease